jgi:hypothetical protein
MIVGQNKNYLKPFFGPADGGGTWILGIFNFCLIAGIL